MSVSVRGRVRLVVCAAVAALGASLAVTSVGVGSAEATTASFYSYTGATPLAQIPAGTVLKTRTVSAHLQGIPLPVTATQYLYRTADATGRPTVTVTSVMQPLVHVFATPRLISYQNAYDSLTTACQPSTALAGTINPFDALDTGETAAMSTLLLQGYTVATADYEGENLAFAAGPGEGRQTLDGIRAVLHRMPSSTKVAMIGYSGGAIATEWAAELAPTYASDLTGRLVGAAQGGVFVDPAHNLDYVNGTPLWSGAIPAALVGIIRAYHVDSTPYLSAYGKQTLAYASDKCLTQLIGHWPGLKYQSLIAAAYHGNPRTIPIFVSILNKLIMGAHGTPNVPMFFAQGTGGVLEGTSGSQAGIGPGDGVMIAGDVRTLARVYCGRHVPVVYHQYEGLDHIAAEVVFTGEAQSWLGQQFAGQRSSTCGQIAPGNSLAPLPVP